MSVPRSLALRRIPPVLLFVAVGLLAADLAVARLDRGRDQLEEGQYLRDTYLGWTNRPGFENEYGRINALGLRSPEIPAEAPPTEVRILGLGASQVFGAGTLEGSEDRNPHMDETWSAWLERSSAAFPGHWRVLNGGVKGYSTLQACRRGRLLLESVDPDLVLVFVAPDGQSLLDPSTAAQWVPFRGELIPRDLAEFWPEPLLPTVLRVHDLLLHSSLYVRHRAKRAVEGRRPPEIDRFLLCRADVEGGRDERVADMMETTRAELRELARDCAAHGAELRAVIVPHSAQYGDEPWQLFLQSFQSQAAPPLGTPRSEPTDVLEAWVAELGIASWNLYPEVSRFFEPSKTMILDDNAHWSPAGHARVGKALQERLAAEPGLAARLLAARAANPRN